MIGTTIRSVRHMWRAVSDTSLKTFLIKFGNEGGWDICKVFKVGAKSPFGECLFIFNNHYKQSHWGYDTIVYSNEVKALNEHNNDVLRNYGRILSISEKEIKGYENFFGEIIMLPDEFDEEYQKFLKTNKKMANDLSNKYGINLNDTRFKKLYIYCDGSKNFFQWGINVHLQCNASLSTLKNVFMWNDNYKQLAKNLSKGTITAYTTKEGLYGLIAEMGELRKEKRINDAINSFNTAQKKLLKTNELSDSDKEALNRFSKLTEVKRVNFIKKMSSVDDFNELMRQMKFTTSVHFSWNKEAFMDFISNVEGIKYEKIYENDNVILVKVLDYETVKQLGKTTNWCISKNKSYWNNYIEHHSGRTTQYMIFDFSKLEDDKLSIIGFTTTHNKGITSAHNFVNDNLMGGEGQDTTLLNSFIRRFNEHSNIFKVLSDCGIDVSLVVEYDKPPYKWDKENLLSYLYECVNKRNVETIKEEGDKLVLSVTDEYIRYFFGDTYQDNIPSEYWNCQHILFIDFSLNQYDINKVQFAIIEESNGDEENCIGLYNERCLNSNVNFENKLIEYGLPYDTIRRTNDKYVKLRNALYSYNTPMITNCLKEKDGISTLDEVLMNLIGSDSLFDIMTQSLINYVSFDYLNMLYDNGLKLKKYMPYEYIADLFKTLINSMKNVRRQSSFNAFGVPTKEDIERLYNNTIATANDTKYVAYYLMIKKIIENEKSPNCSSSDYTTLYSKLVSQIAGFGFSSELFDELIGEIYDKLNYSNRNEVASNLIFYTINYGSETLKELVKNAASSSNWGRDYYEQLEAKFKRLKERNYTTMTTTFTVTDNNILVPHLENINVWV